ncbi:Mth938-like domain-containing protein [Pseudodonghicola xiamenensis]|uniref:Membrane protein n=1 Tax=Pseudodonghicola xiamenensis TaxID=337702 RepID=A0A8J3MD40_9RHOB|nr:Mth938-like domain-containing protein [Pseudodonghicola xiamenensis]GHG93122.1 membrane protein [Pseudodonghicola xiamenensis]
MRVTEVVYNDSSPIEGYGPGFFRIGGKVFQGAVLTGPRGTAAWDGFEDAGPLLALATEVDVIFIGTGAEIGHIPTALRSALEEAGLGVEVMASPAACRTYNVLLSEGRRVAMALLPV